jgi:hypothetical protein
MMKNKFILICAFLSLLTGSIRGQDAKRKFLFLETGIDFISCDQPDKDYIRGDIDPYSYGYVKDQIRCLMHLKYIGIKFEYRMVNNLIGLSGGLRYSRMISSIGRTSYWSDIPDFFYVQFWEDGTTTEYAKVREIIQRSDYLGIPLELRIYPYKDRLINVYYKVGASFNINVSSKSDVGFFNDFMESYQNDVVKVIEGASPNYATYHLGIGLKVGKLAKPGFVLETSIPVGMIIPDNSFVTPQSGGGFQFMVRIPF